MKQKISKISPRTVLDSRTVLGGAKKQKIGLVGENIAVKHLVKLHYKILERNYRKKWGEIDIIAKKDGTIHFIEVKSQSIGSGTYNNVSYETSLANNKRNVSYETFDDGRPKTGLMNKPSRSTSQNNWFRPEENLHPWKAQRLSRAIRTYLAEKDISEKQAFQVDLIAVFIDLFNKKAKLRITQNIIL